MKGAEGTKGAGIAPIGLPADTAVAQLRRNAIGWGKEDADLLITGARVLLASGELLERDIALAGDRIAAVATDLNLPGTPRLKVDGKIVVPGYVDSHGHSIGPYSTGAILHESLARGITYITSDDAYAYGLLAADVYPAFLALAERVPMLLRWSFRPEPDSRTISRLSTLDLLRERKDSWQVGEVATYPELRDLEPDLAEMLAVGRNLGARIEGHSPGASARTLGVAAAAGITADHEAISADEVIERLRLGMWAFLRHNGLRPDLPLMLPPLMEAGISLERTGLTADGPTPSSILRDGMLESVIRHAIDLGLPVAEAYAMAGARPATYVGLEGQIGAIAPGRLANLNLLADPTEPLPERVISLGVEVVRDGILQVEIPEIPWDQLDPARWSRHRRGPASAAFRAGPDDPAINLVSQAIVVPGAGEGEALNCIGFDPESERMARARIFGLPAGLPAFASTLSSERIMVAVGADPEAMKLCVDEIFAQGGGIAYVDHEQGLQVLPLPHGGSVTTAPVAEIGAFYLQLEEYLAGLGHAFSEPVMTLLFMADDGLPGARFLSDGLWDVRAGVLMQAAWPAPLESN